MEPDPDEQQHPGEESLDWRDENKKDEKPKGIYSKTSETARSLISTETQCALFCGGKKCKYCTGEGWEPDEYAITGLYSHWVTDNILAMARPSSVGVKKHNLVDQFLEKGINTIINLQIAGEHADCGPNKLDASGFLYNPQDFMEKGVFFYNFGWPDYGVASLSTVLDMVKVMQFAVSQGKVAIHCHAGRGRTGVIIACYLVFTNRISGREAIHYVREKRPSSIQTRQQMMVIGEFEQYLKPFRIVFASKEAGSHEFSLIQFLNRQRHILHGFEARRLKYVPKILYVVCERLLELAKKGSSLRKHLEKDRRELTKTFKSHLTLSSETKPTLKQSSSGCSLSTMANQKKKKKSLVNKIKKSISMEDLADENLKKVCDESEDKESIGSSGSSAFSPLKVNADDDDEDDDDKSIVFSMNTARSTIDKPSTSSQHIEKHLISRDSDLSSETQNFSIDQSMSEEMSEENVRGVAYALSADKIDDYVKDRAKDYEVKLNQSDGMWTVLATEGDPHVLSLLLWDWLDQLKEPVLRAQDLCIMVNWLEDPLTGLQKLERGVRFTVEYLVKVISKLQPIKDDTVVNIYEKLLSHLTHQWVIFQDTQREDGWAFTVFNDTSEDSEKEHWSHVRPEMTEDLFHFFDALQKHLNGKIGANR